RGPHQPRVLALPRAAKPASHGGHATRLVARSGCRRRSPMITTAPTTRWMAATVSPAGTVRAPAGPARDTTHTAIATPVHTRRAPGVRRSRTRRSPAPATATTTAVTTTETSPTLRVLDPDLTATSTPTTVAPTQTTAAAPAATTATGKS